MNGPSGASLCAISFPPLPLNFLVTIAKDVLRNPEKEAQEVGNKKFVDLLLNRHVTDVSVERKQAIKRFGRLQVSFTQEETEKSAETLKQTLVGKFNRNRPPVDEVKKSISKTRELDHGVSIGVIDINHMILQFSSEGDYLKAWLRGKPEVNGTHFKVFP